MPAASDILTFLRGQLFQTPLLPRKRFTDQTVVITGANSGLGFEAAKHLLDLNVTTLVLGCRDMSKGLQAKNRLSQAKNTATIHVWQVDMASFESVRRFARRMKDELPRLDALLVNAGISTRDFALAEKFEITLTVNVVSAFYLSLLAMPQLQQTADKLAVPTHLSIVGSNVHAFAAHEQLQRPPEGKVLQSLSDPGSADMAARYFLSKLMVMQCARELASLMVKDAPSSRPRVIVNCPSPGWCKTPLFRHDDGGFWGRNMLRLIGRTAEQGSRTLVHAIAAGQESHGQYLSECQVKPPSVFVRSDEGQRIQRKIWRELADVLEGVSPNVASIVH